MGVLIRVHHELDAALDAVLLALTDLVKDSVEDAVEAVLTDFDYRVHQAVLHVRIVWVYSVRVIWIKYRRFPVLYYYGVNDSLY